MSAHAARAGGPVTGPGGAIGSRGAAALQATVPAGVAGGPGRARIGELQRARIVAAMCELVRERGIADVMVAHVVAQSGVSRRTFYELFHDRDACMLAAFEHCVQRAAAAVVPAYEAAESRRLAKTVGGGAGKVDAWAERVRGGLGALLEFFDREPVAAGVLVVDALAARRPVLVRRAHVVEALVDVVHEGGASIGNAPGARRPARVVAEGTVGAVLAVLYTRLSEPDLHPLAGLLGQLMGMIVLPYRGAQAAELQTRRRVPRPRPRPAAPVDPLRDLDMRLTYRTVRVLSAVAEHPGASSRQVADASGVGDQGQMSKLLRRLEKLGLIATAAPRHRRGVSNAWSLTARGREVERAIRSQAPA